MLNGDKFKHKDMYKTNNHSGLLRRIMVLVFAALSVSAVLLTGGYANGAQPEEFHDFVVKDIYGEDFHLSGLQGKKVMVVNTASECGLTPQYEALEALYQQYRDQDFVIIGFPANNFNNQEPGSNEEIIAFCEENYGVSFPMMSKISVRGDDQAPLYQWLTQKELNGSVDAEISWNFQKFLIDENGRIAEVLAPRESPLSSKVTDWLSGE